MNSHQEQCASIPSPRMWNAQVNTTSSVPPLINLQVNPQRIAYEGTQSKNESAKYVSICEASENDEFSAVNLEESNLGNRVSHSKYIDSLNQTPTASYTRTVAEQQQHSDKNTASTPKQYHMTQKPSPFQMQDSSKNDSKQMQSQNQQKQQQHEHPQQVQSTKKQQKQSNNIDQIQRLIKMSQQRIAQAQSPNDQSKSAIAHAIGGQQQSSIPTFETSIIHAAAERKVGISSSPDKHRGSKLNVPPAKQENKSNNNNQQKPSVIKAMSSSELINRYLPLSQQINSKLQTSQMTISSNSSQLKERQPTLNLGKQVKESSKNEDRNAVTASATFFSNGTKQSEQLQPSFSTAVQQQLDNLTLSGIPSTNSMHFQQSSDRYELQQLNIQNSHLQEPIQTKHQLSLYDSIQKYEIVRGEFETINQNHAVTTTQSLRMEDFAPSSSDSTDVPQPQQLLQHQHQQQKQNLDAIPLAEGGEKAQDNTKIPMNENSTIIQKVFKESMHTAASNNKQQQSNSATSDSNSSSSTQEVRKVSQQTSIASSSHKKNKSEMLRLQLEKSKEFLQQSSILSEQSRIEHSQIINARLNKANHHESPSSSPIQERKQEIQRDSQTQLNANESNIKAVPLIATGDISNETLTEKSNNQQLEQATATTTGQDFSPQKRVTRNYFQDSLLKTQQKSTRLSQESLIRSLEQRKKHIFASNDSKCLILTKDSHDPTVTAPAGSSHIRSNSNNTSKNNQSAVGFANNNDSDFRRILEQQILQNEDEEVLGSSLGAGLVQPASGFTSYANNNSSQALQVVPVLSMKPRNPVIKRASSQMDVREILKQATSATYSQKAIDSNVSLFKVFTPQSKQLPNKQLTSSNRSSASSVPKHSNNQSVPSFYLNPSPYMQQQPNPHQHQQLQQQQQQHKLQPHSMNSSSFAQSPMAVQSSTSIRVVHDPRIGMHQIESEKDLSQPNKRSSSTRSNSSGAGYLANHKSYFGSGNNELTRNANPSQTSSQQKKQQQQQQQHQMNILGKNSIDFSYFNKKPSAYWMQINNNNNNVNNDDESSSTGVAGASSTMAGTAVEAGTTSGRMTSSVATPAKSLQQQQQQQMQQLEAMKKSMSQSQNKSKHAGMVSSLNFNFSGSRINTISRMDSSALMTTNPFFSEMSARNSHRQTSEFEINPINHSNNPYLGAQLIRNNNNNRIGTLPAGNVDDIAVVATAAAESSIVASSMIPIRNQSADKQKGFQHMQRPTSSESKRGSQQFSGSYSKMHSMKKACSPAQAAATMYNHVAHYQPLHAKSISTTQFHSSYTPIKNR